MLALLTVKNVIFIIHDNTIYIMRRIILLFYLLTCMSLSTSFAQTYILRFDGIDDYVNLGTEAVNGVRSIELWFNPALDIDTTLDEPMTLIARDNLGSVNIKEFGLSFAPEYWNNSGCILFHYTLTTGTEFMIYSDTNFWEAGKWHHIAITLDFYDGLMMFIDGQKQSDTYPFYESISGLNKITTLGCWGESLSRFFLGRIDDVRLSYNSIYLSDFTPPCPDIALTDSTAALYHFNEGSGYIAYDAGPNGFDAEIFGPVHIMDSICVNVGMHYPESIEEIKVYPNPINTQSVIQLPDTCKEEIIVQVYDIQGRLVRSIESQGDSEVVIGKEDLNPGIYTLSLRTETKFIGTHKILVE